jgi:hypothetical protein
VAMPFLQKVFDFVVAARPFLILCSLWAPREFASGKMIRRRTPTKIPKLDLMIHGGQW